MKKLATIALFSILTTLAFGQKKTLTVKRADKYFENMSYLKASVLYEAQLVKGPDLYSQLRGAECFVKLNDPTKAVKTYKPIIDNDTLPSYHLLNYAQSLAALGDYDESKKYYVKFKNKVGKDKRSDEKIFAVENLEDYFIDSSLIHVWPEKMINTEHFEFAPSFYKDGLVFASSRPHEKYQRHKHSWNNTAFLDLFYYDMKKDTITLFSSKVNSKYHEGSTHFNTEGDKLFFSRNNYYKGKARKSSDGVNKIELFYVEKDSLGWGEIIPFQYDSTDYSIGDPSLSKDFKVLYFVSDMPGGFGGTDIYMCVRLDSGWTKPKNLGNNINTEGNERFPYIMEDRTLYFSSDGHFGLGGLDNYKAEFKDGKYSIQNMGFPLNTRFDDFGLIMKDKKEGYFSSNRESGKGEDDIYFLELLEAPKVQFTINSFIQIYEGDKIGAEGAKLQVVDKEEAEVLYDVLTVENKANHFHLKRGHVYEFKLSKDTLEQASMEFDILDLTKKGPYDAELILKEPAPTDVVLDFIIRDRKSGDPLPDAMVYILKKGDNTLKFLKTDTSGRVYSRLDPNAEYVYKAVKKNYFTNCMTLSTPGPMKDLANIDKPFTLEKVDLEKSFEIELFFDVEKWNIRDDAATELDKVVTYLEEHPGLKVELGAHTDARGGDDYNLKLSQKRAESSVEYIVSKGINPEYITAKGYGETQIKNHCANGVKCSDEEHEVNRRTEIKATGIVQSDLDKIDKNNANSGVLDPTADHGDCEKRKVIKK